MKRVMVIGFFLVFVFLWTQPGEAKKMGGFGNLPLYFVPNEGQFHQEAAFFSRVSEYTLWLTRRGMVFDSPGRSNRDVSRLVFRGAKKNPRILPVEKTAHRVNIFKGRDKARWRSGIQASRAVLYKHLYKNIDLKVYGADRRVEYDWIVHPGGDPTAVTWEYRGVKGTTLDREGNLRVETAFGEFVHEKPIAFQVIGGTRVPVESVFRRIGKDAYGFRVGPYNRAYPLVIDPVVSMFSTYLGGSDFDSGTGIAVDAAGFAYITGYTASLDFPLEGAFQAEIQGWSDGFLVKISPDGSRLEYATFIGGSDYESINCIAVDAGGSACIAGATSSFDFPVKNPIHEFKGAAWCSDGFVMKFSPDGGQLVYSTYLGGTGEEGVTGIAVDAAGSVYVSGYTDSADFFLVNSMQTLNGWNDCFISKFSPDGSQLEYSTLLGGSEYEDMPVIAVDGPGHAYVAGNTYSNDFPTVNAYLGETDVWGDGFLSKLSLDGTQLVYSTYLGGGSNGSYVYAVAVDAGGSAFVAGETYSLDFPMVNAIQGPSRYGDGFVTRFSPDGSELLYSTYLGGNDWDIVNGIAVDAGGSAYVCGHTSSTDFPIRHASGTGDFWSMDAFVARISQEGGRLIYSTYLGGSSGDSASSIALDGNGNAYVTGWTYSMDFPVKNPLKGQLAREWDGDAFITKIYNIVLTLNVSREEEAVWLIRRQYGKIELAVENTGDIPVSRYVLLRKDSTGGGYTVVGEIPVAEVGGVYRINDILPYKNRSYTYKVEAVGVDGDVIGVSREVTI